MGKHMGKVNTMVAVTNPPLRSFQLPTFLQQSDMWDHSNVYYLSNKIFYFWLEISNPIHTLAFLSCTSQAVSKDPTGPPA